MDPEVVGRHCFVHRENLASRKLSSDLENVMQDVLRTANFIKVESLKSRLIELYKDFNVEYKHLLCFS